MYIGKNIKYLRNRKELSLRGLSEILGISDSAISSYERDKFTPDAKNILLFCKYFDTDPNTILLCDMEALGIETGTVPVSDLLTLYLPTIPVPVGSHSQDVLLLRIAKIEQSILELWQIVDGLP